MGNAVSFQDLLMGQNAALGAHGNTLLGISTAQGSGGTPGLLSLSSCGSFCCWNEVVCSGSSLAPSCHSENWFPILISIFEVLSNDP